MINIRRMAYIYLTINKNKKFSKSKIIAVSCISLILVTIIISAIIFNERNKISNTQCVISDFEGINLYYPYGEQFTFILNFNTTIMQANYVVYISTSGGNGCIGCK